jgi:hypothetical protein
MEMSDFRREGVGVPRRRNARTGERRPDAVQKFWLPDLTKRCRQGRPKSGSIGDPEGLWLGFDDLDQIPADATQTLKRRPPNDADAE